MTFVEVDRFVSEVFESIQGVGCGMDKAAGRCLPPGVRAVERRYRWGITLQLSQRSNAQARGLRPNT